MSFLDDLGSEVRRQAKKRHSYVWTFAWFADGQRIGKEIRVLAASDRSTVVYFKIMSLMARPSGFPHAEPVILGREPRAQA